MTIEEMKRRKKELGYSNAMIAQLSGVPLGTVQKIFSGATTAPRYETLSALERILKSTSADMPRVSSTDSSGSCRLGETEFSYTASDNTASGNAHSVPKKRPGEYTLEDYYALPDDQRAELIDGVLYDMETPTVTHQMIIGHLHSSIYNHILSRKGSCLPLFAPVGVQLDCDDKTMVEPDVVIVCDRTKLINRCIYGAPDFVAEVLSPSTKRKDMFLKLNKYMNADVREYWMIDPMKKTVLVYDFEHENYPQIYDFNASVPVSVLDGECIIDFSTMYEYIRFLYDDTVSQDGTEE
ncbi:MAG: Uma2 family endonuclease [Firmicutes bacterium]|nr:Uma2 family endonuclease [Bacillota bacterium]MDD7601296.1 Uma2 family endonuclease [Bacillota bacterium]MDY5856475.1 Uma2 family endonuclease [Anaerovoracaceae bacterium]